MKRRRPRNKECSGHRQSSDSIAPNHRRLWPQQRIGSGHTTPHAIDASDHRIGKARHQPPVKDWRSCRIQLVRQNADRPTVCATTQPSRQFINRLIPKSDSHLRAAFAFLCLAHLLPCSRLSVIRANGKKAGKLWQRFLQAASTRTPTPSWWPPQSAAILSPSKDWFYATNSECLPWRNE